MPAGDSRYSSAPTQAADPDEEASCVWNEIKAEVRRDAESEPALASYLYSTILSHSTLDRSLAFHLGNKLCSSTLLSTLLYDLFLNTLSADPDLRSAAVADLRAARSRDPACVSFSHCLLNYKGFLACQILIGACDWEDYLLNKEGAERYRTHNLPNCSSCPGLYELGIAVSVTRKQGKIVSKLDSKNVIPVYLGQADNVRTRLQQYGRDGAHLENGLSNGEQNDRKVLGLFSDIFSYGFAIAFRWAPMESKKDAEKTESQLLKTFDYSWNRGMNGERRPKDIHKKLNNTDLHPKRVLLVFKKIRVIPPKEVGLRIKHCDPPVLENGSSFYTQQNDINPFAKIFKFGRSRPTLVSKDGNMNNNNVGTCGVALGHGSICIRPPVEGRKRCADHKGMKVNAYIRPRSDLETGTFCNNQNDCEEVKHEGVIVNEKMSTISGVDSLTCVAITRNGSCCRRKPSKSSQFCWQHEALRAKIHD